MSRLTVTIKYLVNFSEKTGKSHEEVVFDAGSDLSSISEWLAETYEVNVPAEGVLNLLNGHGWNQYPEKMERVLVDGDVIIIMPSISGG